MLGNAAGTLGDANMHWVPAEAPESRPNAHLKSPDPVFQPRCTLSIPARHATPRTAQVQTCWFFLTFFSANFYASRLHMWTCCDTPLAWFHLPTCIVKKMLYEGVHSWACCHSYFLCLLNLSGIEFRVQQVQHGQNVVFPFAVACRFLDLFQCCTTCAYPLYFRGSITFISTARGDSSLGNFGSRDFCWGSFAMALLTRLAFWQQSYRHVWTAVLCWHRTAFSFSWRRLGSFHRRGPHWQRIKFWWRHPFGGMHGCCWRVRQSTWWTLSAAGEELCDTSIRGPGSWKIGLAHWRKCRNLHFHRKFPRVAFAAARLAIAGCTGTDAHGPNPKMWHDVGQGKAAYDSDSACFTKITCIGGLYIWQFAHDYFTKLHYTGRVPSTGHYLEGCHLSFFTWHLPATPSFRPALARRMRKCPMSCICHTRRAST